MNTRIALIGLGEVGRCYAAPLHAAAFSLSACEIRMTPAATTLAHNLHLVVLRIMTGGGGGWGPPAGRDPEAVRRDVHEGYVSAAAAQRDYGLTVNGG